jgi:hypothetical protein
MGPHRAAPAAYRLAFDHALCRAVIGAFVRAVLGWYRRWALGAGWADGHSGAVTVIQRFGSGLQLNVHSHALFLDGVFTEAPDGTLRFHPAPPPTGMEVARLVATIRTRVRRRPRGSKRETTGSATAALPGAPSSRPLRRREVGGWFSPRDRSRSTAAR